MEATINNLYFNDFLFAGVGIAYNGRLMAIKERNPHIAKIRAKSIARGLNSGCWWRIAMSKVRLLTLHKVEPWRKVSAVKLSFAEYASIICK